MVNRAQVAPAPPTVSRRTPYLLYNLVLAAASPLLAGYLSVRLLKGKSRAGWSERWGHLPAELANQARPRLWVHAASVGEVMAAQPILQELRDRLPRHEIVVSAITPGGHEAATAQVGKLVDTVVYAPFDVPAAVRRAVRTIRPDLLVVLETEIWPNLLHITRESGARLALVNARISDRSLPRYRRFRGLAGWALDCFDVILAQTELDAERLRSIGAPPARVAVAGNAKFDQAPPPLRADERAALKWDLGLAADAPVLVIGSTRAAEEEELALAAYVKARESVLGLALVHAPRHVERAAELADRMRGMGLHPVRRSEGGSGPVEQLILDTYGELARVYAVADAVFIGNSLVPPGGGQNPVQPLAQGVPVIYGPHMQNFRDVVAQAEQAGVGVRVRDGGELAEQVLRAVTRDSAARQALAERAIRLVEANRGAAARAAKTVAELAVNERGAGRGAASGGTECAQLP